MYPVNFHLSIMLKAYSLFTACSILPSPLRVPHLYLSNTVGFLSRDASSSLNLHLLVPLIAEPDVAPPWAKVMQGDPFPSHFVPKWRPPEPRFQVTHTVPWLGLRPLSPVPKGPTLATQGGDGNLQTVAFKGRVGHQQWDRGMSSWLCLPVVWLCSSSHRCQARPLHLSPNRLPSDESQRGKRLTGFPPKAA